MNELIAEFFVPGEPRSKARARIVNGHAYTPEATRKAEDLVAWAFRQAARSYTPTDPSSYRVEAEFRAGTRQRRDIDNMLKLVLDGLNGIAWTDDRDVTELAARKLYVDREAAGTFVRVLRVPTLTLNVYPCSHCGTPVQTFPATRTANSYCSPDCRNAAVALRRQRTCVQCGVTFTPPPHNPNAVCCSLACRKLKFRVIQPCAECGVDVDRPLSWSTNGKPFCSPEHRLAFWARHRLVAARGTCTVCGGPTSKKTYLRCRACVIAKHPIPTSLTEGPEA